MPSKWSVIQWSHWWTGSFLNCFVVKLLQSLCSSLSVARISHVWLVMTFDILAQILPFNCRVLYSGGLSCSAVDVFVWQFWDCCLNKGMTTPSCHKVTLLCEYHREWCLATTHYNNQYCSQFVSLPWSLCWCKRTVKAVRCLVFSWDWLDSHCNYFCKCPAWHSVISAVLSKRDLLVSGPASNWC